MTVSTTTSRADYTGNGVTTAFTVPFYFLDNTHLLVLRTQISTGTTTTLALTTDYTVTGAGVGAGGTVTAVVAPTSDQKISILRNVPLTQLVHYVPNDPFPAATHEQALDQLTMEVQQLNEAQTRSLALAKASTGVSAILPNPSANLVLGWNSSANALVNVDANTLATSITYGNTKSQTASGTGAQTVYTLSSTAATANNVQVFISGVRQTPGVDYTLSSDGITLTFTSAPPTGAGNILFVWQNVLPTTSVPDASVNTASIVNNAVTTAKIADANVTTAKIADANVTTAKIADANVTTAKIADANVTPAKLANSGNELGMRNRIINGGMSIAQRGTVSLTSSLQYGGPDRWQSAIIGGSGVSGLIASTNNSGGSTGYGLWMSGMSYTSGTWQTQQKIESANSISLNGKTVTVTAKLYHDFGSSRAAVIGLYKATAVDNFASTTLISAVTTSAIPSGAVTQVTATFTLGANDASNGLMLVINDATITTISSKNVSVTDVQLEAGSTATAFDYRPYGTELALCQRYLEYCTGGFLGDTIANAYYGMTVNYSVAKRATPTVTRVSDAQALVVNTPFVELVTINGFRAAAQATGVGAKFQTLFKAEAEL